MYHSKAINKKTMGTNCIFNYFTMQVIVEVLRGDKLEKIPVLLEPKPDES